MEMCLTREHYYSHFRLLFNFSFLSVLFEFTVVVVFDLLQIHLEIRFCQIYKYHTSNGRFLAA